MLLYIILGTLMQKSMTGYEIRKKIDEGVGMFYKASFGSIYPILAKLLEQEMVSCEIIDDSKRNQKSYTITKKGQKHFRKWLESEEEEEQKTEAFMTKVFFFDQLEKEQVWNQIDAFHTRVKSYQQELNCKREHFLQLPKQEDFYYKLSTLYFGMVKLQGLSEWCEITKNKQNMEKLIRH